MSGNQSTIGLFGQHFQAKSATRDMEVIISVVQILFAGISHCMSARSCALHMKCATPSI